MKTIALKFLSFLFLLIFVQKSQAQNPENWTPKQLMEPSVLAETIKNDKDVPLIFSVGPGTNIPASVAIGATNDEKNLDKFKKEIANLPKDKKLVIYCGCCPFEHCPNVRPAIAALQDAKFTNYYLLNLPHNLKKDWIDKGYPTEKE